jgi:hypothetical protein
VSIALIEQLGVVTRNQGGDGRPTTPGAERPTTFVSRESDGGQHGRLQGRPQRPPNPLPPDQISVTGRKWGRTISIPVWSVLEGDTLYLLPVQGSDTQWYKNVLKNSSIRIDA